MHESGPAGHGAWRVVYLVLCALFILTAALNMLHVRGGFFTNHCADLVVPALLYVTARRYPAAGRSGSALRLRRIVGVTPERAAAWIFLASAATELSQRWWPHGPFSGTFDPLDLVSYGVAVALCYGADRLSLTAPSRSEDGARVELADDRR